MQQSPFGSFDIDIKNVLQCIKAQMNHLYRKMLRTGFNLYILIVLVTAMTAFKKVQKKKLHFITKIISVSGFTVNVNIYNSSAINVTCQHSSFIYTNHPITIQSNRGIQYGSCLPHGCNGSKCKSQNVFLVCIIMQAYCEGNVFVDVNSVSKVQL